MTFENTRCFFPMVLLSLGHFVFTISQPPAGDTWSVGWQAGDRGSHCFPLFALGRTIFSLFVE